MVDLKDNGAQRNYSRWFLGTFMYVTLRVLWWGMVAAGLILGLYYFVWRPFREAQFIKQQSGIDSPAWDTPDWVTLVDILLERAPEIGLGVMLVSAGILLARAIIFERLFRSVRPTGLGLRSPSDFNSFSGTAETRISNQAYRAAQLAERFQSRSLLMLVTGIVMAISGVLAFFVLAPQTTHMSGPIDRWALGYEAFRSASALLFIEAIAWFLLRQYRAVVEDYKTFLRFQAKRDNMLTAFYLLVQPVANEVPDETKGMMLASVLLTEEFNDHFQAGQTTETQEAQRVSNQNPVFEMLNDYFKRAQPASSGPGEPAA